MPKKPQKQSDDDALLKKKKQSDDDAGATPSGPTDDEIEGEEAGPDSKTPVIVEIEEDDAPLPDEEDDLGPGTGPIRLSRSDEPDEYFDEVEDEEGGD